MTDLSASDRYVLKAEGSLESFFHFCSRMMNPDLPLKAAQNVADWETEATVLSRKIGLQQVMAGSILGTPAFYFLVAHPKSISILADVILSFIMVFALSVLFSLVYMMSTIRKTEQKTLAKHHIEGEGLYWDNAPKRGLKAYEFHRRSLEKLRAGNLDVDTVLALEDVETEMQLLLRKLKQVPEDTATLEAIDELAIQTGALAYAWKDRWAAEEATVARALAIEGVNVRALIERVAEDTAILSPAEERDGVNL